MSVRYWGARLSPEALTRLFVADIEEGIDVNDYGGPEIERTKHRAGLIKIASGLDGIDGRERQVFEATAEAHRVTGAPILTHTEQGTAADAQVELLDRFGVDLGHVVISHTERVPDLAYHKDILASGVFVEYDSAFRWEGDVGNPTLELLVGLKEAGLLGQTLLRCTRLAVLAELSVFSNWDGLSAVG